MRRFKVDFDRTDVQHYAVYTKCFIFWRLVHGSQCKTFNEACELALQFRGNPTPFYFVPRSVR